MPCVRYATMESIRNFRRHFVCFVQQKFLAREILTGVVLFSVALASGTKASAADEAASGSPAGQGHTNPGANQDLNQRIANAVAAADAAIRRQDWATASENIGALAGLDPGNKNIPELRALVKDGQQQEIRQQLRRETALMNAENAVANSDWNSARRYVGDLRQIGADPRKLAELQAAIDKGMSADGKQREIQEAASAATAAITEKNWDEAERRVEILKQLDSENPQLVSMLNSIMLGRQLQQMARTAPAAPASPTAPGAPAGQPPTGTSQFNMPAPQPGNPAGPAPGMAIANPLPAAGFYDLDQLFSGSEYANYNRYTRKSILRQAQKKLKDFGLYASGIDGAPGRGTHKAIVDWQTSRSLPVTGLLDDATLASMELNGLKEMDEPVVSTKPSGPRLYDWPWPPYKRTYPYRGPRLPPRPGRPHWWP